MPKIAKKTSVEEEKLNASNYASYLLLTLVYYAKVSFKNNLWIKLLIVTVFFIFAVRRYWSTKPETEMIDGMEVPRGGDVYDLTID